MANQLLGQKTILIWLVGGERGGGDGCSFWNRKLDNWDWLFHTVEGAEINTINHHSPIVQRVWRWEREGAGQPDLNYKLKLSFGIIRNINQTDYQHHQHHHQTQTFPNIWNGNGQFIIIQKIFSSGK